FAGTAIRRRHREHAARIPPHFAQSWQAHARSDRPEYCRVQLFLQGPGKNRAGVLGTAGRAARAATDRFNALRDPARPPGPAGILSLARAGRAQIGVHMRLALAVLAAVPALA